MTDVRERPILFSTALIPGVLAGSKTQTRRVAKLPADTERVIVDPGGTIFGPGPYLKAMRKDPGREPAMHPRIYCPYGYPGDRLWVRESVAFAATCNNPDPDYVEGGDWRPVYRADGDERMWRDEDGNEIKPPWKPSIHMPRWASRITLEITNVRAERLHEITEEDARAEGTHFGEPVDAWVNGELGKVQFFNARDAFAHYWNIINGKRAPWKSNPWIWAVTFKRVEQTRST